MNAHWLVGLAKTRNHLVLAKNQPVVCVGQIQPRPTIFGVGLHSGAGGLQSLPAFRQQQPNGKIVLGAWLQIFPSPAHLLAFAVTTFGHRADCFWGGGGGGGGYELGRWGGGGPA